jgi:sterol desaturase/sphingolipid hydroxylase (fatty acid hydroxylase superfamily)
MHGIHHSQIRTETDSNYGSVLPWWDRLHRTLGLNIPQADIVIGVPGYEQYEDNRLPATLIMPFRKQRDYWFGMPATRSLTEKSGEPAILAE